MNDKADAVAEMPGSDRQVALDRAGHELRAGRPIILDGSPHSVLVAALDTVSPSIFSIFQNMPHAALNVSAQRAKALGLAGDHPAAIGLAGLEFEAVLRFAAFPISPDPNIRYSGSDLELGMFELCKRAMLRPILLSAPTDAKISIPAAIHRISRRILSMPLANISPEFEIVSEADVALAGNIRTRFLVLRGGTTPRDQVAIIVGRPDPEQPVPVWIQSACLTGDVFGSLSHGSDNRLRSAVECLSAAGGGVLLYLDPAGRAYAFRDADLDMLDANAVFGDEADGGRHEHAAAMLIRLGYRRIVLLTNNPVNAAALRLAGIDVAASK